MREAMMLSPKILLVQLPTVEASKYFDRRLEFRLHLDHLVAHSSLRCLGRSCSIR
jgi:hypothetical protein